MQPLFSWDIPLRWADIDQLMHVNNVTWYRYISEARVAWLQSLNALMAAGASPVVAESGARFLKPATYPDTIRVDATLLHMGTSSLRLEYALYSQKENTLCVTGFAVLVWTDLATGRSTPIPAPVRLALSEHLSPHPS